MGEKEKKGKIVKVEIPPGIGFLIELNALQIRRESEAAQKRMGKQGKEKEK